MKSICVLGSTGSIGVQTLEVAENLGLRVVGLAAGRNAALLNEQVLKFRPDEYALGDDAKTTLMAAMPSADIIVNAIGGMAGIRASFAAVSAGKDLALANKETVVAAGKLLVDMAKNTKSKLLPIDSEHSAIWQCIDTDIPISTKHDKKRATKRLILTASGGAFRNTEVLSGVTREAALNHPTWKMGKKVTIDSATLMNKGFEVIEAHHLFDVPIDDIDVVVHPQSVIHSLVEFADGATLAQLGPPDMRVPIQYALTYPDRSALQAAEPLDLLRISQLTFEPPDERRFPCLRLAREAAKAGGNLCAVLVGADEAAVELFLAGRIGFTDIPALIERALAAYNEPGGASLEAALEAVRAGYEAVVGAV